MELLFIANTIVFASLFIVWTTSDFTNLVCRVIFFIMFVLNGVEYLKTVGYIIKGVL